MPLGIRTRLVVLGLALVCGKLAAVESYSCRCKLITDDLTLVTNFEVKAEGVAIDCDDYNGMDVSVVNPQQGPMRSPYLTASLAACQPSSENRVQRYSPKPYYFPYHLQPGGKP